VVGSASCSAATSMTSVSMKDPRIQPLLAAATKFDRVSKGFTPLPVTADLVLELDAPGSAYDAMLHIYGKTSRTIAFQKTSQGWKWIGEQETHEGPGVYTDAHGVPLHEEIAVTYNTSPVDGHELNQIDVEYSGDDPRLGPNFRKLTLADVAPFLKAWDEAKK